MSRINNSVFESVSASLVNQAQRIIVENLNNGNLVKLRTMFNTETINNLDDLQSAMNKYNIRGILPHMVYELKVAGLFEPEIIEAFTYMLANVRSKDTKDGTLDFIQANKWIENNKFTAGFIAKNGFTKSSAYRAVAAMYNASKNFRNIVTVEHNPWDMDTHKGAMRFLYSFYRQFPNLFFAQTMIRKQNKIDMATFATMLIATTILDLVYNSLLLVALGVIPFTALIPFHKDFIFKENPGKTISIIVSRNPIFGVTGNLVLGAGMKVAESMSNINSYRNAQNEYAAVRKALGSGFDELNLDFVPSQALETLAKDPIAMAYVLFATGGNLNEQETHDFYNAGINYLGRGIPLFGELPVRIAAKKAILGDRPTNPQFGGTVQPVEQATQPSYREKKLSDIELREKAIKDSNVNKPLRPPPGLLR
jgi:hypothetical protein